MMESLSIVLTLVSIAFCFLQIILFFKVWGMCNDVAEMNDRMKSVLVTDEEKMAREWLRKQRLNEPSAVRKVEGFAVGDNVIYEPLNRRMIIREITPEGLLDCFSYRPDGTMEDEGKYKPHQVRLIS